MMKKSVTKLFLGVALTGLLMLAACQSPQQLIKVEGSMIAVDSAWDKHPDAEALALLAPYKAKIDSMMYKVVGVSGMTMKSGKPESLLPNLVSDVLRESATAVLGKPADMGLVNMGGLRNILSQGEITCGNIYEILPFENSLCVLTVKGSVLRELFAAIALKRSVGVSGVRLVNSPQGELLEGTIGGAAIDNEKLYTVATIDYLADGNDGMDPLVRAVKRECPEGLTLRDLFMAYVAQQTKEGKKITSRIEGRITIKKED